MPALAGTIGAIQALRDNTFETHPASGAEEFEQPSIVS
jgi:hypothetical protein